jgi:outer membrane protein assembly factor BamB
VNSHRNRQFECSRRRFITLTGLASSSVLIPSFARTDRLFAASPVLGQEYRVVRGWPQAGCPQVQCRGIDGDHRGRIYVAGNEQHPVLMLDAAGKYLGDWGRGVLAAPHGVRVQGKTVWVTDVKTHQVHQFTRKGELICSFGRKGEAGDAPDQFDRPTDFAFGPDGAVYISDGYGNTRVVCLKPNGEVRKIWGEKGDGPGQFDLVHAIAIDRQGLVYVGDRNNSRIQIFDLDGNFKGQWKHVGKPYGLYACQDGTLIVCGLESDSEKFRVLKLASDGEVLAEFGETGDGPGQFLMAHSVYADQDGGVFVADGTANRVQKFQRL